MQQSKIGCLIIHGFGGGLHEIETIAEYLSHKDYIVACPRLKGHTGNRKDMRRAKYNDWLDSAEIELLKLKQKADSIVIIGFSMGGLIAVNLACKYDIKAIVTINTPIFYWNLNRVFLNLASDIKNKKADNFQRYMNAKRNSPAKSMVNFLKLLNITKSKLTKVTCPFLIIQAKDDDTVKVKSVYYIYNNINSKIKYIKFYENGGHLILKSNIANKVSKDVEIFLNFLKNNKNG